MDVNTISGFSPVEKLQSKELPYTRPWHCLTLAAIALVSAFLNFFQLSLVGYGNQYYAAAVKSMLLSWHNFFFLSFDPGGFVTIDKPPLGFWLQAASAKLLGFSGWALLLPEALAGIASVLMLYLLVRRAFGPIAGLLAALALALSPISVVMNRSNNIDGLLTLAMLIAAWAVSRATERGQLRWLLLGAAMIGLGFNIKTLEAFLVVPALGLLYLLGAPIRWPRRLGHLLLATLVLLIVSLSWITVVDVTPAAQRPYVGSSQTNSELELAVGYNGLQRLLGRNSGTRDQTNNVNANNARANADAERAAAGNLRFGGESQPGALRLFSNELGGQISWLLPLAILGLLAAAWQTRRGGPLDRQQRALVLWGTWLLTMGVFFSVASFFHSYYMTTFAPAICALFAIGLVTLWRDYRRSGWQGWLLPIALAGTALVQVILLAPYTQWSYWLSPLIGIGCLLAAVLLTFARGGLRPRVPATLMRPALTLGVLLLLLAPAIWSAITTTAQGGASGSMPSAGPRLANNRDRNSRTGELGQIMLNGRGFNFFSTTTNKKLEQYLLDNQGDSPYLLATSNASSAAPIILDTNQPVMALGGFGGSDPILNRATLLNMIANGTVRFFLLQIPSREALTSFAGFGRMSGQNSQLASWIQSSCKAVPQNLWQATAPQQKLVSGSTTDTPLYQQQLYDCSGVR